MTWSVEFTPRARKDLQKLPIKDQRRIADFLRKRVLRYPNPRLLAKRLIDANELWRFRVGDYRIIVQFQDARLIIMVIEVGNRREVYR